MNKIALRFVKWGTGRLVLGLWTGYGPLHHYLHGHMQPSSPWAPVHGHVVLLGRLHALRPGLPRPPGLGHSDSPGAEAIDGAFLTLLALGCVLFLVGVFE